MRSEGGNIVAELGSLFRAAAEHFARLSGVNRIYVEQAARASQERPGAKTRRAARAERRHRALTR